MKPESIPLSELTAADEAALPKLTADDIYRLLAPKVLRGRFISAVLFAISIAGLVFTLPSGNTPWAVASGLGCALFGFAFFCSRQKLDLARRISREPELVFWAHPTVLRQRIAGQTIDTTFISLHTRAGASFEVGMSREQMLAVVVWLRQHNPEIRLGAYDSHPPNSQ